MSATHQATAIRRSGAFRILVRCGVLLGVLLVLAERPFAASVTLAWDPVVSPVAASGYVLYYGPAAGDYTTAIDVGDVATRTVSGLAEGATYHFAVTAYDSSRAQSGYSNDVGVTLAYAPMASFTASTTSGTAPLALNFINGSTGTISAYAWSFGDGTASGAPSPTKMYGVPGAYTVSLTVTGPGGSNTQTRSNYVVVSASAAPGSGSLGGSYVESSSDVDFTAVGSRDWVRWPGGERKATGGGQIANYQMVGGATASNANTSMRLLSWQDGSPTATGATTEAVRAYGPGGGFLFTAPAGAEWRTLVVYAGAEIATGKLTAQLSDGSAPDFVSTPVTTRTSRSHDFVYTLRYRAASDGQMLTVTWTQASTGNASGRRGGSPGCVRLQGAALQ